MRAGFCPLFFFGRCHFAPRDFSAICQMTICKRLLQMFPRLSLTLVLSVGLLQGCATTSAALDGVGGVFIGASDDVRALGRR